MTTEYKTEPEVANPTTEDEMKKTLRAFRAEAEGAIKAFRVITVDIEKRLTERVQTRAVEQSKSMQGLGERIDRLDAVLQAHGGELMRFQEDIKQIDDQLRDHAESLDGQAKVMFEIERTAKQINESAGARFGDKLEAMGAQVAELVTLGERMVKTEHVAGRSLAEVSKLIEASNARMDDHSKKLDALIGSLKMEQREQPKE